MELADAPPVSSEQEGVIFDRFGPLIALRPGDPIGRDYLTLNDTRNAQVKKIIAVMWQADELAEFVAGLLANASVQSIFEFFDLPVPPGVEGLSLSEIIALLRRAEISGFAVQVSALAPLSFDRAGNQYCEASTPLFNDEWFYVERLFDDSICKMLVECKRKNARRLRAIALQNYVSLLVEDAPARTPEIRSARRRVAASTTTHHTHRPGGPSL